MPGPTPLLGQPRLRCIAALAAIALASCAAAADAVVGRDSSARINARVVELVNAARSSGRQCGSRQWVAVPTLTVSRELNEAAAAHARDMARADVLEHRGTDGSQPRDRVVRTGYQPRITGENVALGPESAEKVVAGWLASPGHCENIMDPRFQHIGVALAVGKGQRKNYWAQVFAAPKAAR